MSGFAEDAKKMLALLGGKENIVSFTHCATRMRFVLKDQKIADVKKIEELPSVKGSFTQGGQFQIIIGNKVSTFYDDFVEASGIEGVSKAEVKSEAKGNDSSFSWIVSGIYGLCYPLMVITGLHHAMLPIDLQAAEVVGGIYTFPVVALNNIAQASAVVAFVIINRKSAKAKEVGVPAFISGYLGVTEPAMFGRFFALYCLFCLH